MEAIAKWKDGFLDFLKRLYEYYSAKATGTKLCKCWVSVPHGSNMVYVNRVDIPSTISERCSETQKSKNRGSKRLALWGANHLSAKVWRIQQLRELHLFFHKKPWKEVKKTCGFVFKVGDTVCIHCHSMKFIGRFCKVYEGDLWCSMYIL